MRQQLSHEVAGRLSPELADCSLVFPAEPPRLVISRTAGLLHNRMFSMVSDPVSHCSLLRLDHLKSVLVPPNWPILWASTICILQVVHRTRSLTHRRCIAMHYTFDRQTYRAWCSKQAVGDMRYGMELSNKMNVQAA